MSKKTITILCVVLSVLLFVFVLLPRIIVFGVSRKCMPDVKKQAMQFSEYPVSYFDGDAVIAENDGLRVTIPAGYELEEKNGNKIFRYEDGKNVVVITKSVPFDLDLTGPPSSDGAVQKKINEFFGTLGNGLPDSGFATEKFIAQLKPSDYSFLSFKKGLAFTITGLLKSTLFGRCDSVYILEKGDIKGIITVEKREDTANYRIQCELFSTKDLNTANTLLIAANSPEDAYPIINSASFK